MHGGTESEQRREDRSKLSEPLPARNAEVTFDTSRWRGWGLGFRPTYDPRIARPTHGMWLAADAGGVMG
jgi:hypothetical protein